MPKVVIYYLPLKYYIYFQWFLVGLYQHEVKGNLKVEFNFNLYSYFFYFILPQFFQKLFLKYIHKFFDKKEIPIMRGWYEFGGDKKLFCYEINDSPFWFSDFDLFNVDIYFKAQHPLDIIEEGFQLSPKLIIKYPKSLFEFLHKVRPSMLGPRMLCVGISRNSLLKAYEKYIKFSTSNKSKFLMSYFGTDKFPTKVKDLKSKVDFNDEASLMFYYKNHLSHPNIKRGIFHNYLYQKSPYIDSRLISSGSPSILLSDFQKHVSQFKYNFNISGFRMSIPNRFIDSFSVGTCIVTDKLKVKWYLPFTSEVVEIDELGYLEENLINWPRVFDSLDNLMDPNSSEIICNYNEKWSPEAFIKYIIHELKFNNE
jgi:hypothetical protein